MMSPMRRAVCLLVCATAIVACSKSEPMAGDLIDDSVHVSVDDVMAPFDDRLLGTNVPAWLGPELLTDTEFLRRTAESGATLLRFPGGSWSNSYDWLACENGEPAGGETPDDPASMASPGCWWTDAARPSDFVQLMRDTGLPAMWTVSFNATAQQAAALVAFFNGNVGDTTVIGVDRHGRDWKTVGEWAELRADHGHPEPQPITLWEVGNEIYGATSDAGPQCASFGWENVWTCDGTAYIEGDGDHDGFLAFREAMRAVDPTIMVGAVGVPEQDSWGDWGNEVIDGAGDALDFYVVHHYGFDGAPRPDQAVAAPREQWPEIMADVAGSLSELNPTDLAPVAVTEYNLIAVQDADTNALMTKAVSALYVASNVGEMATLGVSIANHWNLANGRADNGTDYGMIDVDTGQPNPAFYAMALWSRFGDELVRSRVSGIFDASLAVYASRSADGSVAVIAVNSSAEPVTTTVRLDGFDGMYRAGADVVSAPALDAPDVLVNGGPMGPIDLSEPAQSLGLHEGPLPYTFTPYSVTLLRFTPGEWAAAPVSESTAGAAGP